MKGLLSFVGRGFFSWVSVFLSFVLSKEVTSETSGLSAIMKSYREREKTHLISRIHYNGWLQRGGKRSLGEKGARERKGWQAEHAAILQLQPSSSCSHWSATYFLWTVNNKKQSRDRTAQQQRPWGYSNSNWLWTVKGCGLTLGRLPGEWAAA